MDEIGADGNLDFLHKISDEEEIRLTNKFKDIEKLYKEIHDKNLEFPKGFFPDDFGPDEVHLQGFEIPLGGLNYSKYQINRPGFVPESKTDFVFHSSVNKRGERIRELALGIHTDQNTRQAIEESLKEEVEIDDDFEAPHTVYIFNDDGHIDKEIALPQSLEDKRPLAYKRDWYGEATKMVKAKFESPNEYEMLGFALDYIEKICKKTLEDV